MDAVADDVSNAGRTWTPIERFGFRAAFAYFALFGFASLLDSGAGPRTVLSALHEPIVGWFGHTVLRLSGSPNDAGASWAIAQQIVAIVVAVAIAGAWSVVSRRTDYRRLHGWMRLILRYYVGIVMIVYGGFKVIPTQFPPISLDQLSQPLGSLSPMGLLWSFMGYSVIYAMFTGFGESIGAFLLFFRRTTTVGALVLVAVLSNVALLNYAYDVPVKQLSSNLLLASIVLILPDVRRLLGVLFLNRTVLPADLTFRLPHWLQRARRFVKPIVVAGATLVPLAISSRVSPRLRELPPLFGIYEVKEFVRNGAAVPPLATDSTRWRSVVFGRPGVMTIRFMTDSVRVFAATVDSAGHHVTVAPRAEPRRKSVLDYERLPNGALRVSGTDRGDSIAVTLERLDQAKAFRLLGGR